MAEREPAQPAILGLGTLFVIAGVLLLLQEAFGLAISWSIAIPAIIVAVGAAVMLTALRPTRTRSGT